MKRKYKYDVFISFDHQDESDVGIIHGQLEKFGLDVFWSKELRKGKEFVSQLEAALCDSQHFVLYCSKNTPRSKWVKTEWQMFYDLYHSKDEDERRMFVLCSETCDIDSIPDVLKGIHRPKTSDGLLSALYRAKSEDLKKLQIKIDLQEQKIAETQRFYRYHRFWGTIAEQGDVHIFTCGRDKLFDPKSSRGDGGRTSIDMWDYRAVFDITHFFASNYPNTKLKIEEPVSYLIKILMMFRVWSIVYQQCKICLKVRTASL